MGAPQISVTRQVCTALYPNIDSFQVLWNKGTKYEPWNDETITKKAFCIPEIKFNRDLFPLMMVQRGFSEKIDAELRSK